MVRAAGMQVLTRQIQAAHPGVTVYGIGDEAHKLQMSGHNEDDTPGVRAEDQDADSIPEHRAIDVMIGPAFSAADADVLVAALVHSELDRKAKGQPPRLIYINWGMRQWSRSIGWASRDNSDDPHTDHVHISGEADADADITNWTLNAPTGDDMGELDYGTWERPQRVGGRPAAVLLAEAWTNEQYGEGPYGGKSYRTKQLDRIEAGTVALTEVVRQLAEVVKAGGGSVDTAKILAGVDERLAVLRAAIDADNRDTEADALEGGAAQVRADT